MEQTTVTVKQGTNKYDVVVDLGQPNSLTTLQATLQQVTGVFTRNQKLIYQGKVLDASKGSLAQQGVTAGAKVMMLASANQSSSQQTRGQVAASTAAQSKAAEAKLRIQQSFAAVKGASHSTSVTPATACAGHTPFTSQLVERRKAWRASGILMLREANLASLSETQLFEPDMHTAGTSNTPSQPRLQDVIKTADMSLNKLSAIPGDLISQLKELKTLRASHNQLCDNGVPWNDICNLPSLMRLFLDSNRLSTIPGSALIHMQQLRHVCLSSNGLTSIPPEVGHLQQLQVLEVDNNQLQSLPDELGNCKALETVTACSNQIIALTPCLSTCTALQSLKLDQNRICTVPSEVLQSCTSLWQLSLAGNPITVEQLRSLPGFQQLDERRRARANKQINGQVMFDSDSSFYEGADAAQWSHWDVKASGLRPDRKG